MLKVCCDICERPMVVEDGNTIKLFRTREIDTRKLYPHMCENCSNKIDEAVRYDRNRYMRKSEILARMNRLNKERKERLRTEG